MFQMAHNGKRQFSEKGTTTLSGTRNPQLLPAETTENVKFFRNQQHTEAKDMDEKDKEIIRILKQDGRAGYSDIGKQIGLSEGAVRKRIKVLADAGVIRKFTVRVGVAEGAEAITLLATNPAAPTQEVSEKIRRIPNVETVYEVTGEYDIVAVISGMSVAEVNECIEKIRRINGIMKTNTMIVLRS
jgi:DNA-binding Lrp family transcriptional regulator